MARTMGIDLGSREIKVIAGRSNGPLFELDHAFAIPVAKVPEEQLEEARLAALSEVAATLGKGATSGARYSISGRELIIRYTKVPPVSIERLKILMDFEVREMSEQAGETLASDYNLVHLPGRDEGDETVLVAVVKEGFLNARHEALVASLGAPKSGMPASLALFNAYLNSGALHEGEFVYLIDIGEHNVEMALQRDGELIFARNVAFGGSNLTQAVAGALGLDPAQAELAKEQFGDVTPKGRATYASGQHERVSNALIGTIGQLASMLQSGLGFARAQTGIADLQPGRVLVSGGTAALKGLCDYLAGSFGCPVERFQPESGLGFDRLAEDDLAAFEADPGLFAVALGLAVSDTRPEAFVLDLIPEKVVAKRRLLTRTVWNWAAAAVAILCLVGFYMALSGKAEDAQRKARKASREASAANRQKAEYEQVQETVARTNARVLALEKLSRPGFALARVQAVLQRHQPSGVWIKSIGMASELPITVTAEGVVLSDQTDPAKAINAFKSAIVADPQAAGWSVVTEREAVRGAGASRSGIKVIVQPYAGQVQAGADESAEAGS